MADITGTWVMKCAYNSSIIVPEAYQRATAGIDVQTTRRFGSIETTKFLSD
jgi:hypothetical protein